MCPSVIKIPTVNWAAAGEDAATWLTEFLGKPVRLVKHVGANLTYLKALCRHQQLQSQTRLALGDMAPHRVAKTQKKPVCSPKGARVRECNAGEVAEGTAETNPKRRACEPEFGNGTETMFADGYPYLLTTEVSHLVQSCMSPASQIPQAGGGTLSLCKFSEVTCYRGSKVGDRTQRRRCRCSQDAWCVSIHSGDSSWKLYSDHL